ncbi:hypothetical protein GIS00_15585 [Nakamurella sp. YIM 132087]|uniref:VTT domain-containing protein n=1 Tax=Nakamurella alba TaxID=2665158 RepID=A0A7K1FMH1_9ACTN|nr:VTT domain-containing protein [Nakamurella alba]MTD15361.1 hypothetical protein [Nakamurella alba]
MPSWVTGQPFLIAASILAVIVFCRAQATYWIARGAATGALRSRFSAKLSGPGVQRATRIVHRYGPPVITVSFLTVGFQTVMNAAAGLTRMPFGRYLLAMIPGCLLWAVLYATVGLAAIEGAIWLAVSSPWAAIAVGAVLVGGLVWWALRRRARRREDPVAPLVAEQQ